MSYPTEAKNFNLGRRLGAALSRRVLADYGLAEVVFADAMGISVGTVKNLKAGKTKVSGELLIRILRFFERADPAFRREVFDGTDVRVFIAAPDDHQLIDDLRTFEDARSRLKRRFG